MYFFMTSGVQRVGRYSGLVECLLSLTGMLVNGSSYLVTKIAVKFQSKTHKHIHPINKHGETSRAKVLPHRTPCFLLTAWCDELTDVLVQTASVQPQSVPYVDF